MQVEFATTGISAMYTVSLATAMKVRREYEVRVGGYGTSVGGYGRIWELGTIWDLCGRVWEDMGAQDDMEPLWEDTGGYMSSGHCETSVGRCGRVWQLKTM